jgi:ectoine hydroxylase-related dioxygenase (phytanoyl-CoA dioxygenase family)
LPLVEDSAQVHERYCLDREEEYAARTGFIGRALTDKSVTADPAARPMLTYVAKVARTVNRQGYCVLPDMFGANCVERMRQGLEPLFARSQAEFDRLSSDGTRPAIHIHNVLAKSRAADEAALDPLLRMIIGTLLGHDFVFHAGAIVTAHSPGCMAQQTHRDDASFYALPRPRMPLVVTAAIALDDFNVQNGATQLAPESCWWERSRQAMPDECIPIEMSAGSVLFWDGAVFHGAGANTTSDRTRRTLFLNYTRGWLRTQLNQFLAVPRAQVLAMPAALQKDLGYTTSLRSLGECDGIAPIDYLQAIAQSGDGIQEQMGQAATGVGSASAGQQQWPSQAFS